MPTTTSLSRADQIGALFVAHAEALRTHVARQVNSTDDVLDEACAFAWVQLLSHPDVDLADPSRVYWWLYRTAQRQAWQLHKRTRRELPAGHPLPSGCDRFSTVPDASVDLEQQIEDREELRELHTLRPAVRDTIVLHACGYSYTEIRNRMGVSATTILKRVRKARTLHDRAGG